MAKAGRVLFFNTNALDFLSSSEDIVVPQDFFHRLFHLFLPVIVEPSTAVYQIIKA
jgi:hypothetical protein